MDSVNDSISELRVTLERVAGDVRLISERQIQQKEDVRDIKERIHANSTRLQVLEAERQMRKGATAVWTAFGGLFLAVLGMFAKLMGWV